MNRIYQGRASKLEILNAPGSEPTVLRQFKAPDLKRQDHVLWQHHEIFQDAVNYYVVALAALARGLESKPRNPSEAERLTFDLTERIRAAWDRFPKEVPENGDPPHSLRRSLRSWLGDEAVESFENAAEKILESNDSPSEIRRLSLQLLLSKCSGDSAIQQMGRGYLPAFCASDYGGSWDYDRTAVSAAVGKNCLASVLHSEAGNEGFASIAAEMDITWAGIKCKPNEVLKGEALASRLLKAVDHQQKRLAEPKTAAESDFLARFPDANAQLEALRELTAALDPELEMPINKGGNISWDLIHAAYLFKVFPSAMTAALLAMSVKKPTAGKNFSDAGPDFSAFDDDPIKLARGSSGYVFPAFTALPAWNPISPGKPVWKEFDIAAFKEALKGLNQFHSKTIERANDEKYLRGKIAIQLGADPGQSWAPRKNEAGDPEVRPEPLDPHRYRLVSELEERLTAQLADTVVDFENTERLVFGDQTLKRVPGQWRVSVASLRGFSDIAEKWHALYAHHGDELHPAALEEVVKGFQREEKNRKQIGSIPLLLALCERPYWDLWKASDGDDETDKAGRFLYQIVDLHRDVRDLLRARESINLTPAEPRHSRRLYMFSDISGREKLVFNAPGELETTLATRENGACRKQRVRIHYRAPRLHRDQLLGGEESQWLQPMIEALGLGAPNSDSRFVSAVSLMPDFDRDGGTRFLLNFPKTLDPSWIHQQLGKKAIWSGQFNGTKDKNLHLHWPQNQPKTKQAKDHPWWENRTVIEDGFTALSVDLGQRTAGAWALLGVTPEPPQTKRPAREIGHDGTREWHAEILKTGMLRLPGEDPKVLRKEIGSDGKLVKGSRVFASEMSGKAGRKSSESEYREARKLAEQLGVSAQDGRQSEAGDWVGKHAEDRSLPEQNDGLLALAHRRLSRLATFHRWSCLRGALARWRRKAGNPKTRREWLRPCLPNSTTGRIPKSSNGAIACAKPTRILTRCFPPRSQPRKLPL
jgi:hypothetical protein